MSRLLFVEDTLRQHYAWQLSRVGPSANVKEEKLHQMMIWYWGTVSCHPCYSIFLVGIICGLIWGSFAVLGSFAVQFWNHLRSNFGIICGPGIIWGPILESFAVPGIICCPWSFAVLGLFAVQFWNHLRSWHHLRSWDYLRTRTNTCWHEYFINTHPFSDVVSQILTWSTIFCVLRVKLFCKIVVQYHTRRVVMEDRHIFSCAKPC